MPFRKNIKHDLGFTLIELLTVIGIIGIIAAIAIPNFLLYKYRSYNSMAKIDIKNAYTAAQAIFNVDPNAEVSKKDIEDNGYRDSPNVVLEVVEGKMDSFKLTSFHLKGNKTFSLDAYGRITSTEK